MILYKYSLCLVCFFPQEWISRELGSMQVRPGALAALPLGTVQRFPPAESVSVWKEPLSRPSRSQDCCGLLTSCGRGLRGVKEFPGLCGFQEPPGQKCHMESACPGSGWCQSVPSVGAGEEGAPGCSPGFSAWCGALPGGMLPLCCEGTTCRTLGSTLISFSQWSTAQQPCSQGRVHLRSRG